MYDNILVPTDGSEGMSTVIDHAAELAAIHDATLHALHVTNTASLADLPMESSWEGVSEALKEQGREAIEEVERGVDETEVETAVLDGSPAKRIVNYAEENDCDCIVMGTHGRSGVDRLLLGSVAERVIRTSPVPVTTIHVNPRE
jgi:nucleotide-binding universal stress UspA family protein